MQVFSLKSKLKGLAIVLFAMLSIGATSAAAQQLSAGAYGYSGKGKTTCGGLVNGKLEKSCGATKAVFEADAVGECPKGSFFDVGKWSCWTCPKGFVRAGTEKYDSRNPLEVAKATLRALVPVDGPRACVKENPSRKGKPARATYQGKVCPKGSFFDPTRDGECWSCPSGYKRSVAPVEWADACVKAAKENFKKINRYGRATGLLGTDCPSGKFWDAVDGHCYSCPSGYSRTGNSVKSSKACMRVTKAQQSKATLKGKAVCKPGEILDIRNDGECWTCPTNYDRTVSPINGKNACEIGGGWDFARATESSPLTCQSGQVFDLVNAKHKKVQALIKAQFKAAKKKVPANLGKKGGGTCWSCPTGYRRTVFAVWDKGACESNGISWKAPTYNQPGLFGLKGAADVVRELIAERKLIEEFADGLAPALKKSKEQTRRDVWEEISTNPSESAVLKLAVFSRLQAAATNSAKATAAERTLLSSFEDAVVHYQTFLAEQALQAYQAWDAADKKKNEVYSTVMVAGVGVASVATGFGASAGLYAMGAEALRNELWPLPDFTDITLRSVIEDQVKGQAVGLVYTKALLSKPVLRKLFPSDAAAKVAKKALTEATEAYEKKLGQFIMQKLSKKVAQKAAAKGAGVTAKAVAKAFASAGPQILAEVAIDTVIAYLEMQIERANAEPRLKANVAEAKRSFKVKRLLATVKGSNEVSSQWAAAMGGAVTPAKADKVAIQKAAGVVLATYELAPAKVTAAQAPKKAAAQAASKWVKIGGSARDVAVGSDGTTYAIGVKKGGKGGYQIFKRAKTANKWTKISGAASRVAVMGTQAWVVTSDGQIFSQLGNKWKKVPGPAAQDIGASAKGVWIIDVNGKIHQRVGNDWKNVPGTAYRIDIDQDGRPWVVNKRGNTFTHNNSQKWVKFPGSATDVAADVPGQARVVGTDGKIYVFNATKRNWDAISQTTDSQAIGAGGGQVWSLNKTNEIFRLN